MSKKISFSPTALHFLTKFQKNNTFFGATLPQYFLSSFLGIPSCWQQSIFVGKKIKREISAFAILLKRKKHYGKLHLREKSDRPKCNLRCPTVFEYRRLRGQIWISIWKNKDRSEITFACKYECFEYIIKSLSQRKKYKNG